MSAPVGLLACDLDGTLVGDEAGLAAFRAWRQGPGARVVLAYLTGRTWASARALQAEVGLPEPDWWGPELGTRLGREGLWDASWQAQMQQGWVPEALRALLAGHPSLRDQGPLAQGPFKLAYEGGGVGRKAWVQAALSASGWQARVVGHPDEGPLDLLPISGGKGAAMWRLVEALGFAQANCLACGDGWNDLDLLAWGGPALWVVGPDEALAASLPPQVQRCHLPAAQAVLAGVSRMPWPC